MKNKDAPDMPCENEFCSNHVVNCPDMVSDWNKTRCSFYEIDPYEAERNDGIRTDTCKARLRFMRMWAVEQKNRSMVPNHDIEKLINTEE
jgi:hypothetical protein